MPTLNSTSARLAAHCVRDGAIIESLACYVDDIKNHLPNSRWIFRGQSDINQDLLPKAGRAPYMGNHVRNYDLIRFKKWCHQIPAFVRDFPDNEFERLAFAQHYGLATRLLDWTLNAVAALYFATEDADDRPSKTDGVIFMLRYEHERKLEPDEFPNVASCGEIRVYQPRPLFQRVMAQDSLFTIHPRPDVPMAAKPFISSRARSAKPGDVLALFVPRDEKKDLQRQLRSIGILRRTLFPDVEGLSRSINWQTADEVAAKAPASKKR